MLHQRMISGVFVVALTLWTAAIAQQGQFGTAAEAKAMLERAVHRHAVVDAVHLRRHAAEVEEADVRDAAPLEVGTQPP